MSFVKRDALAGKEYAPGFFLASADCTRETQTIKADDASAITADNGGKYVPMGATFKDGTTVKGVVYEDVDVTFGDMPGSVVTRGVIYKDRLVTPDDADALKALGFTVIDTAPEVTRPDGFEIEDSAADTSTTDTSASGDNTATE